MGRHRLNDRPQQKCIHLPTSLVEEIDEQVQDPLTKKPRHGGWSSLVAALLNGWLDGSIKLAHMSPTTVSLEDFANDSERISSQEG
jgi:hypothetical protein